MNYQNIHNSIIARAKDRNKERYLERHHIIPKSLGGLDVRANMVYLTTREHFIIHTLLVRIYDHDVHKRKKMVYALWWMSKTRNGLNGCTVTSHSYAYARKKFIENNPQRNAKLKEWIRQKRANGDYLAYDKYGEKISATITEHIKSLTPKELANRMKKSVGSCDHIKRGKAISRGKASQVVMKTPVTDIIFWSSDNVKEITGFTWDQIRYRIRAHDGNLTNGNTVSYISRYKGNDHK